MSEHTNGRLCVVCDAPIPRLADRCTNQCCLRCHGKYCTQGGSTEPGHGINLQKARAALAKHAKVPA